MPDITRYALAAVPAALLVVAPIVLYVKVTHVLMERVLYFLLFTIPMMTLNGLIPSRVPVAKLCQLAFRLPLIPLTMALCFGVPVNVFHFTTEPMLRQIRMSEHVSAKELAQLGAKFMTLVLATMPILYVLDVMQKVIRDAIYEFLTGMIRNNKHTTETGKTVTHHPEHRIEIYSQHLLRKLLEGKNRYWRAGSIVVLACVSTLPMLGFLEFSSDFYERTLAVSSCINSGLRAILLIWYTCTPTAGADTDQELTKSITDAMYSRRTATIFLTLLTAVLVTWRTGLGLGFESARVLIADFLGGGTLLCFTELVEFMIMYSLPGGLFQRVQGHYISKTTSDWIKYLILVSLTSVLMVLSSTTRFQPLIAVGISTLLCIVILALGVRNGAVMAVLLVAPLCLVDEAILFTRGLLAVVIISSTYIFRLHIGERTVDANEPNGREYYGRLNDLLLLLRMPMLVVLVCFFAFALCACLQETGSLGGFGKAQAYFEQDAFTSMFDEGVASAPISRLAFCGPKQKVQDALGAGEDCYAVCDRRWFGLDVMDLTLAASMAYVNVSKGDDVMQILTDSGSRMPTDGPADWTLRYNNVNTPDWVAFLDIYSPSRNLSIISIRGSAPRAIDWLEDLSLFGEITIFSTMAGLVPGLSFWPVGFFESFFNAFQTFFTKVFSSSTPMFYTPVVRYAYDSQASKPRNLLFTGHSLGGAVAKIAGTLTGHQSIGISSPGVYSSRKKFMYERHSLRSYDIRRLVTNIISEGDYVPAVGKLGGSTTELYCGQGPQCHSIWITICELYSKCPNGATGSQLVGSRRSIACEILLTAEKETITEIAPSVKKLKSSIHRP